MMSYFIFGLLFFAYHGFASCQASCSQDVTSSTDRNYQYPWPQVPSGVTGFTFKVRTGNDAHVALSAQSGEQTNAIEIVFGGWDNSKVAIRRCIGCNHEVVIDAPNLLSPDTDTEFFISYGGGLVTAGRVGEAAFISHQFSPAPTVNYIGIHTGWGTAGTWSFCCFSEDDDSCCPGFYEQNCYRYFNEDRSWSGASSHCQGLGAQLVSIHSAAENSFVNELAGGDSIWIGLTDAAAEDHFVWSDGTSNDFENFSAIQPDNANGNQDCVKIGWSQSSTGWDDFQCNRQKRFMCKY